MFEILNELTPTYTWPVKVCVAANGGGIKIIKFDAEFRRLDNARLQEIVDQKNDNRPKTDIEFLVEVLASVGERKDGQYLSASDEDAARLRAVTGADKGIVLAYYQSISGEKAKN